MGVALVYGNFKVICTVEQKQGGSWRCGAIALKQTLYVVIVEGEPQRVGWGGKSRQLLLRNVRGQVAEVVDVNNGPLDHFPPREEARFW